MNTGMEYMDYRMMDVGDDTLDYRFDVSETLDDVFLVFDAKSGLQFECQLGNLKNPAWDVWRWFYKQVRTQCIWDFHRRMESDSYDLCRLFGYEKPEEEEAKTKFEFGERQPFTVHNMGLIGFDAQFNAQHPEIEILPSVPRSTAGIKDRARIVPKPIIIVVNVDGKPARTLVDTGSLCDFISAPFAKEFKIPLLKLDSPLMVQLAASGSKTQAAQEVDLAYQGIRERRHFDIVNVSNYDLILGTPFLWQHCCIVGFNNSRMIIWSNESLPIKETAVRYADPKKPYRYVPEPITVTVKIDGKPANALLDSGSVCDFMSTTLADQLRVPKKILATPLVIQLAIQGSRTKVNYNTEVDFEYENIHND
jgi:hypothetical protein